MPAVNEVENFRELFANLFYSDFATQLLKADTMSPALYFLYLLSFNCVPLWDCRVTGFLPEQGQANESGQG